MCTCRTSASAGRACLDLLSAPASSHLTLPASGPPRLEFAADQYRRLVAGAERLLRELAGRGAVDGEQSGRIQQWMCSKQETEECLRQEPEAGSELRRPGSAASDTDTDAAPTQQQQRRRHRERETEDGGSSNGRSAGECADTGERLWALMLPSRDSVAV